MHGFHELGPARNLAIDRSTEESLVLMTNQMRKCSRDMALQEELQLSK